MNIQGPLVFDIQKIYALIHKREEPGFTYVCKSRAWDGFVAITDGKCTFNNKEHGDIAHKVFWQLLKNPRNKPHLERQFCLTG